MEREVDDIEDVSSLKNRKFVNMFSTKSNINDHIHKNLLQELFTTKPVPIFVGRVQIAFKLVDQRSSPEQRSARDLDRLLSDQHRRRYLENGFCYLF